MRAGFLFGVDSDLHDDSEERTRLECRHLDFLDCAGRKGAPLEA